MSERRYSPVDHLLGRANDALRALLSTPSAARENPATVKSDEAMDSVGRISSGRLMRINHAGEICAQALYQGQALTARDPDVRKKMEQAAREENDHLAWTQARIHELGTHTSRMNPLWYAGSFAIGAIAGLAGDRWSLGFIAETERQVVQHLNGHLTRLPPQDGRSRAILERMRDDEGRHASAAVDAGAVELPLPIKQTMRAVSKIMTATAYWL